MVDEQDMQVDQIMGSSPTDFAYVAKVDQVVPRVVLDLEDDVFVSLVVLLPINDVH